MTFNRNRLSKSIRKLLPAVLFHSLLSSGFVYAQDNEDNSNKETLNKTTITGSRIKRFEADKAIPVTTITREQIELSGESNTADLIRSLTFNSSGSIRPQSGSSAQGVSEVSLRGLGASRSLVLIDGRRMPRSPSTGNSQDLNLLPMGAIERIEILADGASAIYGSDAIGGVINIITRTDYEGFQLMLGGAEVSIPANGGDRQEGSLLFGSSSEKSSIVAGVSWNNRDIIFARDLPWNTPAASVYGNNFTTLDYYGNDNFDWTTIGDCNFPDTGFFILGQRCAYDFTLKNADEASIANKSLFVKAKHQVNDNWQVWANASVNQTESFGRYAPVPDSSYLSTPLSANSPNNPTNPNGHVYDPSLGLDPQAVNWWHRFDALGNRDTTVTSQMTDLLIGTTGQIGDAEVEFGLRHTNNRSGQVGRNFMLRSAAFEHIESGAYDLSNPYGSSESILNSMRVTTYRDSKYDQDEIFGSVAFDIFEMENGAVSALIGAEARKDKYADIYDPLSESGQIGGSTGNSAAGNREIDSLFFEVLVPLMADLEMNIAGRYDDYSDFGSNFSPKVSFRYQPLDKLTLRASFNEGYMAPQLPYVTKRPLVSTIFVNDPSKCPNFNPCPFQITETTQTNLELKAEDTEQFSLGLDYSPTDWVNISLDYYNIQVNNRIRFFNAQAVINADVFDELPSGLSCIRNSNGIIIECITGFSNQGKVETSGLDLNAQFDFEILGGHITSNLILSHLLDLSVNSGTDFIHSDGFPQQRSIFNNLYRYSDWSIAYDINMIGSQYDYIIEGEERGHVPTWVTHDLQLNYQTPWNGKITLGAKNIGEKAPPIGLGQIRQREYDFNLYDGFGRITYLRYTQTF